MSLITTPRMVVGSLALLAAMALPAWGRTDKTCLTGSDPAVLADGAQIAAFDARIAAACPCAEYDGSQGRTHRDYLRCSAAQLKAATKSGALRPQCKGRMKKAYAFSTCGYAAALDAVACIERNARGKIACRVMSAGKCVDSPGRYTRVACSAAERCIDAGDSNGDYLVDSSDSSQCRLPAPTRTATVTATATQVTEDTATPTEIPTRTPSASATDTPAATHSSTGSPTATPTPTNPPTATVGAEPPLNRVTVDPIDDPQSVVLPPNPDANACPPQQLLGGGCAINGLDGSLDNYFDARASTDPASSDADDPTLSFYWQLFKPPGLSGAPYSSNGITGYRSSVLTIHANALPELAGTDAGQDISWRASLTVTSSLTEQSRVTWFRFQYQQSTLTLQMSTACQIVGAPPPEQCAVEAINGLPATEPTGPPTTEIGWTFCASEGGTCNFPGNRTVRFGADGNYVSQFISAASVPCTTAAFGDPLFGTLKQCAFSVAGSTPTPTATGIPSATPTPTSCTGNGAVVAHADINVNDDPQSPPLPPDPAALSCPPQSVLGGGCAINPLDGSVDNVFDASASVDAARCNPDDPPPSYHWELFKPPGLGGAAYSSNGITGYHGPVLTIRPSSLPSLFNTDAGEDILWRVRLTVTSNVGTHQTSVTWFRFDYEQSALTLQMSTDCQRIGHLDGTQCTIEATNGLPATEPT